MPDAASSPDQIITSLLGTAEPTGEAMLRLSATQTACVVISDAAQSLRRMSMVFEAAATAALVRSLEPGGAEIATAGLEQAERTMRIALDAFSTTTAAAIRTAAAKP